LESILVLVLLVERLLLSTSSMTNPQQDILNNSGLYDSLKKLSGALSTFDPKKLTTPQQSADAGTNRPVTTPGTTGTGMSVRRPVLSPLQNDGKGNAVQSTLDRLRDVSAVDPRSKIKLEDTSISDKERNKIRREVERSRRERRNQINAIFDAEIGTARVAGEDALGRSRALNARAGILSSPIGEAQTDRVRTQNREVVNTINARRAEAIAAEFDKIDEITQSRLAAKTNEAMKNREDYLAFLGETQTKAKDALKVIASQGLDINQIDEKDFKQLLDATGMDELTFNAYYNANLPKAQQIDYKYQNLGNGNVAAFWVDADGTLKNKQFNFPINQNEDFQVAQDGTPLIISTDEKGKKSVRIAEGFGEGQFRKPLESELNPDGEKSKFKFQSADRESLVGGGYSLSDISGIEADVEAGYSFEEILNNTTNESQKNALRKVFGQAEAEQEQSDLTRENMAKFYGVEDNDSRSSFLGFEYGKSNSEFLDEIMAWVDQQKAIGYDDKEIRKALESGG